MEKKIVYCKKMEKVIIIDAKKEPNRRKKYWHRSGVPFDGAEKEVEVISELDWLSIEELRAIYTERMWRPVANSKKNDKEWIISKLR